MAGVSRVLDWLIQRLSEKYRRLEEPPPPAAPRKPKEPTHPK